MVESDHSLTLGLLQVYKDQPLALSLSILDDRSWTAEKNLEEKIIFSPNPPDPDPLLVFGPDPLKK